MDGTLTWEPQPARRLSPRLVTLLALAVLVVVALTAWVVVSRLSADETPAGPSRLSQSVFQQNTGVRVLRVAVTGAGGLVDLRYQVIDPDKAQVVHVQVPKLVDEETGEVVDTLFMGHSHGGDPKAGYSYPLLFVNPHGLIQPGRTVSVVIGDVRLEHVPVF